tara:strand:+ start:44850 stop:45518 length:669 start_codon:yes stop_codon:yes gene_type:complete
MVTIKEITDDRFYNKIENLKKEIDSNFKKNKNKNKCIILLNIILDIILFLVMPIFSYFVLSKITALFLAILFSLLIFIFSDLVIYFTRNFIEKNSKDYKYNKKLKRKIAFYNIKKYKENKGKKLKTKSMIKFVKKLNQKEIELIEKISELEIYNKDTNEIIFQLLYKEIENSSIEKINIEKPYILKYIEKNKNNDYGVSIEKLLKKNIIKEEKVTTNIINMI